MRDSSQKLNRKQLEKAIQKQLEKSDKNKPTVEYSQKSDSAIRIKQAKPKKPSNWSLLPFKMLFGLFWWVFMQPEKYIEFLENADAKQIKYFNQTVQSILIIWFLALFAIPLGSVTFGFSPATNWLYQNNIEPRSWFWAILFTQLLILLTSTHTDVQDFQDLDLRTKILMTPLLILIVAIAIIIMFGSLFVVAVGVYLRSREEFLFMLILMTVFVLYFTGIGLATGIQAPSENGGWKTIVTEIISEVIVGSGLRARQGTLMGIIVFAILIIAFGILIWIYFFNGWQSFCACPVVK